MNPLELIGWIFRKLFGSRNERLLKRYARLGELVSAREPLMRGDFDDGFAERSAAIPADLPDPERAGALQALRVELSADLRSSVAALRQRAAAGEAAESLIPDAFAVLREASRRAQNHRQFDCQIVGGQVLFEGKVAEMKTGEGKTIVCHLPALLKYLQGKKVHIVTVNDYLVQRDARFAQPIFELLGVSVGFIQSQVDPGGHEGIRQKAYACDLTYGTNNEFGFDYLRDNMKVRVEDQCQGRLDYAIIDEVDSILIDEARTPLIISGPAEDDVTRYRTADNVARIVIQRQTAANNESAARLQEWGDHPPADYARMPKFEDAIRKFKTDPLWLTEDEAAAIGHLQYYIVARERKSVHLTHEGIGVAQEQLGVGSLYVGANMEWPHLIENAVRAHVVYERDVDYVVKDGEVIIVDEFTGRLMYGRQWSDGLHQAVEAKESVRIKEESQTLATITLQNFFKLYDRIAGMTGTAMTEADEFMKIYRLDVVAIPTNRPVNRVDHNDRIYKTVEDKYDAIVEEIHEIHARGRAADPFVLESALRTLRPIVAEDAAAAARIDEALARFDNGNGDANALADTYSDLLGDLARGRPVLVGTISVERSEQLSNLLTRKYGIEHEVLNAKQHAREADIVAKAGHTHLPARGKDRRPLGNVTIATNMAGRGTDIKLERGVVYEKCVGDLGPPTDGHSDGRWKWREAGVIGTKCCIHCPDYDPRTRCAHCWKPKLDPRFPELGRKVCPINVPCGLHIVGTERHESRRIDNQLRGRSGRQGDPGSSRFFLSMGDDLLRMFMGEWTLKMLERMGFEAGMAIEARSINKGIERAQKKVEERNFGFRKHLLEYDEVMDHQRQVFYRQRQAILESSRPGRSAALAELIWKMIDQSIDHAAARFLAEDYPVQCMAEWVRGRLECPIDPKHIRGADLTTIDETIRRAAMDEARNQITITVGEYMDAEVDRDQWDIRGLARWAETRFGSAISQNQLRKMSPDEVEAALLEQAEKRIAEADLAALERFLDPGFARESLLGWARQKFGVEMTSADIADLSDAALTQALRARVRSEYQRREITYPVEWAVERTLGASDENNAYAADALVQWVNLKFNVGWTIDQVRGRPINELAETLLELNRDYMTNGKLEAEIDHALASDSDVRDWARRRFGPCYSDELVQPEPSREALVSVGRALMRYELTMLERYVLLQIYDQAWKDHMHAMDLLKEAIGLRGFAEQDPKIAYKREGFKMFQEMMDLVQDRVTSIIFKARLTDDARARTAYNIRAAQHAEATNLGFAGQTDEDRAAGLQAQTKGEKKVETIRREQPRVGRNDPCPCGSGKKYKQCHGRK
ncbi:MAG: SEC-C domain-containing protein [Phycisphaerae bacterium]|nr:SEC-C domain-containing protein [Phycisphaerae bacterium]